MVTLGAYEVKTHLSSILDRVAAGERIAITKHGVPVAILQPVDNARQTPARDVIAEMKQFRKGRLLDGLTIRDMIEDGRP